MQKERIKLLYPSPMDRILVPYTHRAGTQWEGLLRGECPLLFNPFIEQNETSNVTDGQRGINTRNRIVVIVAVHSHYDHPLSNKEIILTGIGNTDPTT